MGRLVLLLCFANGLACTRSYTENCDVSCRMLSSCGLEYESKSLNCAYDGGHGLQKCAGITYDECPFCLAEKHCADFDGGNPVGIRARD